MRVGFTILVSVVLAGWARSRPADVPFQRHLIDPGASETAAFADINGDGRADVVSGEFWYEAPRWIPHRFREIEFRSNYIDDFSDLPLDVDADGHIDIISCSWFAKKLNWWRNPGRGKGAWTEQVIDSGFPIEAAMLVDLDNDGKEREILPQFGSKDAPLAWYELGGGKWIKHVAHPQSVLFGFGAGDVNKDGRNDILTARGWLEAPPDPRAGPWQFHQEYTFEKDLSHIFVLDLNGDGRNDLLTSYAHDYGIFWMEQLGGGKWRTHMIDETWSQPHSPALIDMNGDKRPDLLVGKRYMAHNGRDPGEREPLGVYWYEYEPADGGKRVEWTRHLIDYGGRAGAGTQISAGDYDRDGDIDVAAGAKSGLFLFENLTRRK